MATEAPSAATAVDLSPAPTALVTSAIGVVLTIVAALALRLVDLQRIPAWYTDEGLWSAPPRDYILFSNWAASLEWHHYLSPFYALVLMLVFSLFGTGIPQARAMNAVLGCLTIGMAILVGRRAGSTAAGVLAGLALAVDGPSIITNRSGILESLQTLLVVVCALFALGDGAWRRIGLALCLTLALVTKPLSLYVALPIVVYAGLRGGWRRAAYDGLALACGVALAGVVFGTLALRDPAAFSAAWLQEAGIRGLVWLPFGYQGTLVSSAQYFVTRSPILLLALLATTAWAWRSRKVSPEAVLMGVWVVTGVVAMSLQGYSPNRYYIPIIPIAWLFVFLVLWPRATRRRLAAAGLVGVHAAYALSSVAGYYYVLGHPDTDSARTVQWLTANARPDERIVAPLRYLVGTVNAGVGYEGLGHPITPETLAAMRIDLVVTAPETRLGGGLEFAEADPTHYQPVASFGDEHVFRVVH